jgi:hypothetical protein
LLWKLFEDDVKNEDDKLSTETGQLQSDPIRRLDVVLQFITTSVSALGTQKALPATGRLRRRERDSAGDTFYDHLADLMMAVILRAASIKVRDYSCWMIQHNMVWEAFFRPTQEGPAWKIVRFKLRRLLYDEIMRMNTIVVNFQSARVLGYCLYVMGLVVRPNTFLEDECRGLHRVILEWTRRNYLQICEVNSDVADACLVGSLSYDASSKRLVKTYGKGLERIAPREFLDLVDQRAQAM